MAPKQSGGSDEIPSAPKMEQIESLVRFMRDNGTEGIELADFLSQLSGNPPTSEEDKKCLELLKRLTIASSSSFWPS